MKGIFSFIFIIIAYCASAQTTAFHVVGATTIKGTSKPEPGLTVEIVQNGKSVNRILTNAAGKYDMIANVDIKTPFFLTFSKSGLVTKKILFDFSLIIPEDLPPGEFFWPGSVEIEMMLQKENQDFSYLDAEPVAKFFWDTKKLRPEGDKKYGDLMRAKIEKTLSDAAAGNIAREAKYQALLNEGQTLQNQKKYEEAIKKYEGALEIKPTEELPTRKINELDALIAAQKRENMASQQAEGEYQNLIASAKTLREQKKYEQAIAKFNEALTKKDEQFPKDQIKELEKLAADAEAYNNLIKAGDAFLKQSSFKTAREKYEAASKMNPAEEYPKTRMAEIDKKMVEQNAQLQEKKLFNDLVAAADALFKEEKWEEAKAKYNESLKMESGATYSIAQVKECDEKITAIAKEKEKAENLKKLLGEGATLYASSKWTESQQKYTQVLALEAENAEAKTKLADIAKKIEEEAKLASEAAKFNKLVAEGDAAVKGTKWADAKSKYEEALKMKADAAVQTKLEGVNQSIKEQQDQQAKETQFQALKAEGLKLATEQKWEEAKAKLNEALAIHPDPAVTAKLTEIDTKLKAAEAQAKLESEFKALMDEAAAKESSNDIDGALDKYKAALAKKPADATALAKVGALTQQKAQAEKQKADEAKFTKLVADADALASASKLGDAKAKYEEALKLKADAAVQAKLEGVNTSIKDQQAKETQFQTLKAEGFKLATEQKWDEAKTKLNEALAIHADPTITTKLGEIDTKQKAAQTQAEAQAKLESEFKALMDEAAAKESSNDIDGALDKYKAALAKKSTDATALAKVGALTQQKAQAEKQKADEAKFTKIVADADALASASKLGEAKAKYEEALKLKADAAVQAKLEGVNTSIKDQQAKETQFQTLKAEGFKLATEQKWEDARTKLNEALAIHADPTITTKLGEIDTKQKAAQTQAEAQAKLESEFKALMDEAAAKESSNDIDGALDKYKAALAKKSTDATALAKVKALTEQKAEADKLKSNEERFTKIVADADALASASKLGEAKAKYEEALKLKADAAVQAKLEGVNTSIKDQQAKETQFQTLKAEGFKLATEQKWEDAKTKLNEALAIHADPTITTKLGEIDTKQKAAQTQAEAQAKLESEFKALMDEAAAKESSNDIDGALDKYKAALAKKSTDATALAKVKALTEQKAEADKLKSNEERFTKIVADADALASASKLGEAKAKYEEALKLKADAAVQAKLEGVNTSIKDQQAKETQFQTLKAEGFKLATEQKWDEAKTKLNEALAIHADPTITTKLGEIDTKQKATQNQAEAQAKLESEFKALMDEAAAKESSNDIDGALDKYKAALAKKSTDATALAKVGALTQQKAQADKLKSNEERFTKLVTDADALASTSKLGDAKAKYEEALKLKADAAVQAKLEGVNTSMKDQQAKETQFQTLKAEGFKLATEQKWEDAKTKLNEALAIHADPTITTKLGEIDTKQKATQNQTEAQAKLESEFKALMDEAAAKESSNDIDGALDKYKAALAKKSTDATALAKVGALTQQKAQADKLKSNEEKFNALKSEGMSLASNGKLTEARTKLVEAKTLRTDTEIDTKLAEIDEKIKATQSQAQLDADYNALIASAKAKEKAKDLVGAIEKYKEAASKKPTETELAEKIRALEEAITASSHQKDIDQKYATFMKKGLDLMAKKQYTEAIKEFNQAGALKPEEKEPALKSAEAQRLAQLNSTQEGNDLLEKLLGVANKKIEEGDYAKAKELLNRVSNSTDPRPKDLLKHIEELERINKEYASKMKEAEQLAKAKKYTEAIATFEAAKIVKPKEVKPVERISELKLLIDQESSLAQKEAAFKDYVAKGEASKTAKKYNEALGFLQHAQQIKPTDKGVIDKITEVKRLMAEQQNAAAKINEEYQKEILTANNLFKDKDYEKAIEAYTRALAIKPNEKYPKEKLTEIDEILNAPLASSTKLLPLGQPYNSSIMDGYAALEKAEAQRKSNQDLTIKEGVDAIAAKNTTAYIEKSNEQLQTQNTAYTTHDKAERKVLQAEQNRLESNEVLRTKTENLENTTATNAKMAGAEELSLSEIIVEIENKNITTQANYSAEKQQQDVGFKTKTTEIADATSLQELKDEQKNVNTNQQMQVVERATDVREVQRYNDKRDEENAVKSVVEIATERIQKEENSEASSILSSKVTLNNVNETLAAKERAAVYVAIENGEQLKEVQQASVDAQQKEGDAAYAKKYATKEELDKIAVTKEAKNLNDEASRNAALEKYDNSEKAFTQQEYEAYALETAKYLDAQKVITTKHETAEKEALSNGKETDQKAEDMKRLKESDANFKNQAAANDDNQRATTKDGITTKHEAAEKQGLVNAEGTDQKAEDMKRLKERDANFKNQAAANDDNQRATTKDAITTKHEAAEQQGLVNAEGTDQKAEDMKRLKERDANFKNEAAASDDSQRSLTNSTVVTAVSIVGSKEQFEAEKKKAKDANFEQSSSTMKLNAEKEATNDGQKHLDAQATLNALPTEKPIKGKVANALGQEYPEGVSQESFTQSDSKGLMKALITRRVVVNNGQGDVYVRTQTTQTITYTKNGVPTTEMTWQRETENPKLKKNY